MYEKHSLRIGVLDTFIELDLTVPRLVGEGIKFGRYQL